MASDHIRYDLLTQQALRGLVRDLLIDVAKKGLPGEHHFFIAFDTLADGVKLSQRMRAQYPEEMTIVLQHQFWDLTISEDRFEVGLSFNGIPERLTIPFAAIKGFFDPSVQFGLQFEEQAEDDEKAAAPKLEAVKSDAAKPPANARSDAAPKAPPPAPATLKPPASANSDKLGGDIPDNNKPDGDKPAGGGEVVRLDRFRKK